MAFNPICSAFLAHLALLLYMPPMAPNTHSLFALLLPMAFTFALCSVFLAHMVHMAHIAPMALMVPTALCSVLASAPMALAQMALMTSMALWLREPLGSPTKSNLPICFAFFFDS